MRELRKPRSPSSSTHQLGSSPREDVGGLPAEVVDGLVGRARTADEHVVAEPVLDGVAEWTGLLCSGVMSKLGVVVVLLVLLLSAGACAESGPTKQDVVAKIKADPNTKDTPDIAVECIADWYMTRPEEERTAFVQGQSTDREPDQAVLDCVKNAAP
ncbi:hypothetical protein SAMN04488564_117123 [Lentzea waywayandensis]|uniref:Uncharacterized protein n=1 Tax=Lentzea waywayandensis TaxID=84724 RepID=A0A1I6FGW8_9PSEU|nr:hypothetical protein [Lentzea waywayandensis]SFR29199.1 hypothetical protein SAMN04488564_117123 [Lentzea waywayandensis]